MLLLNLSEGKEWRRRCREWTCEHSGEGESGTNGESGININTLSGVSGPAAETLWSSAGEAVWALR